MSINISGYNISDIYVGSNKIDKIFVGEDLVYSQRTASSPLYFELPSNKSSSTIKFKMVQARTGTLVSVSDVDPSWFPSYTVPDYAYSFDLINWNAYTIGQDITLTTSSNRVYFKTLTDYSNLTDMPWYQTYTDTSSKWSDVYTLCVNFQASEPVYTGGVLDSLVAIDYDNISMLPNRCYLCMFAGDCLCNLPISQSPAGLYSFENMCANNTIFTDLSGESLLSMGGYAYYGMFNNCTSLTVAPTLPATTLALGCYYAMFYNCTSLTTAPVLPATTMTGSCYSNMFYGCTSLTVAPTLPATTLASNCYDSMFNNCTSLTTAPALPVTTLASYCYSYMFCGCTSLTVAPVLPATTMASYCYDSMFYGCNLTKIPPLRATVLADYCYSNMFYGLSSSTSVGASVSSTNHPYIFRIPYSGTVTGTYTDATKSMFRDDDSGMSAGFTVTINGSCYINKPVSD